MLNKNAFFFRKKNIINNLNKLKIACYVFDYLRFQKDMKKILQQLQTSKEEKRLKHRHK
jgi:hypothetical protein